MYVYLCKLCVADTTGEYSIYTEFKDTEIMFHVSTLLPYTPSNKQQVSYPLKIHVYCVDTQFCMYICSCRAPNLASHLISVCMYVCTVLAITFSDART